LHKWAWDCSLSFRASARGRSGLFLDAIWERLEKAGELGAIPINFLQGDPIEQIKEQQLRWRSGPAFHRIPGPFENGVQS